MKALFILLTVLIGITCFSQEKTAGTKIYNKDFKWTITIPAGFDTVSTEKWNKMQNRGSEAVEKTYGAKVENRAKTIFVFQSNQFNYFESNYQHFDTAKDGNYHKSCLEVERLMYGTFEAQMKGAKLDSSSSTATINGLLFYTFKIDINLPNNMVLIWRSYSRLFGKKDFTVNIMTLDRQREKELLDSWLNSTFGK